MKHLALSGEVQRTLREMGIFHAHPRTRMRAQRILRLSQGLTLAEPLQRSSSPLRSRYAITCAAQVSASSRKVSSRTSGCCGAS